MSSHKRRITIDIYDDNSFAIFDTDEQERDICGLTNRFEVYEIIMLKLKDEVLR